MKNNIRIIILFVALSAIAYSQPSIEKIKTLYIQKDYEEAGKLIPQVYNKSIEDIETLLIFGDIYSELDKYKEALEMYQKALKEDKKNLTIIYKTARTLVILKNRPDALELLKDAAKRDEKNVQTQLELAKAYLAFDSLNKAELIITRARELDKKNPDAFLALGDLYFAQKVYELARQNYEEALSLSPDLLEARMRLATSYYWLANRETDDALSSELFSRSLKEWNTVTQQDPKNAKAFFEQGKIWFYAQKWDNAAKSLSKFIELRPSGSLGRWWLAQSFEKIRMYDSAVVHYKIVMNEIDTIKIKAKLSLARCAFDIKDYPSAISSYLEVKKDTTLDVIDYQKIGQSFILIKDTLGAINIWNESIAIKPEENCRIMDQLGYILQRYIKKGDSLPDYLASVKLLEKRVSIETCNNDKNHIAYYYIGNGYNLLGQQTNAIDPLKKSLLADSNFLYSRLALGDAYTGMKDITSAEIEFNKIIEIGVADTIKNKFALSQSFSKLSGLFLETKKFNEVIKIANRWVTIFPNDWAPYLYLAISNHQNKNFPDACKYYRKVISLNPKQESAKKNLKLIQESGGCGE